MAELTHEQLRRRCYRKPSDFETYGQRRRLHLTLRKESYGKY
jgi:hypothetical protein